MTQVLCEVEPLTLKEWMDRQDVILIDVREGPEFTEAHLATAKLFPISNFEPDALPDAHGKKLVFYCRSGHRSAVAALKWAAHFDAAGAYHLKGGILAWKELDLPCEALKG